MPRKCKNSVGIWAFGPNATRFMPTGYHPEAARESIEDRVKRAVDGLGDLVDGFELHYPNEINEENAERILKILGDKDVYCIPLGTFCDPKFAKGSFINPDENLRREAIEIAKRGVDLAAELGSNFIIWPGGEGYNYLFEVDYAAVWRKFIEAIAEITDHANRKGVTIFLEHKNSEPAMRILMRNVGLTIYVIRKVADMGVDTSRLKINLDWMHLFMNGEPLPEHIALLMSEGLLGHLHANSGWDHFDDDNMTGCSYFFQTLETAKELQRWGYGRNGERVGFDLFPYTEDQVAAVRRAIIQWEFIWQLAERIDDEALQEAKRNHDAVKGYEVVYEALGLTGDFVEELLRPA